MKKPDEETTEMLWKNLTSDGTMLPRCRAILSLKGPSRENAMIAFCKVFYTAGVERGYDLGYLVFSEGDDGDDG